MAEGTSKKHLNDELVNYNQAVENSLRAPPLGYIFMSHDMKCPLYGPEEDLKDYSPLQSSVERVFSKPLFCCGGSLKLSDLNKSKWSDVDKFLLKVKPSTSDEDKDNWKEFKLTDPIDVEELLKYSNPATFGDLKEMKTLVDSEVRLAKVIESERFKLETNGIQFIRKHIAHCRFGRYYDTTLNPYKLNIYSEGGFFQPHVDSPAEDEMIGTLVVCLPSYHKGGELCVNHDGLQHVFDFSEHSGDASRIQWAAFYSNCIHEVKPVLEGHRLTITYNIISSDDSGYYDLKTWNDCSFENKTGSSREVLEEDREHLYPTIDNPNLSIEVLSSVNNELEKIQDGSADSPSKIGILLKHRYTPKGLQQHLLKGEDKALFEFLVGKQWKCKLVSVLSRYQTDAVHLSGWDDEGDFDNWHQVYGFDPSPPKYFVPAKDNPKHYTGFEFLMTRPTEFRKWRLGIPFIDAYRRLESDEKLVRNESGENYWVGNECDDIGVDRIYLESALIVDL